jgi:hypothetical protein
VMREQWCQVDAVVLDHRQKSTHAFLSARTQRRHDPLIPKARIDRFIRSDKLPRIDPETGQGSARS